MSIRVHVDVVSAEELIFSGETDFAVFPGEAGELGIYPRHTPLLTRIKPGTVPWAKVFAGAGSVRSSAGT